MISICLSIQAQTRLTGTVLDKKTGEPIFGANIFIENSTVGATSDPDGKFTIKNIRGANQKVVITHVSYGSQTVPLRGRTRIDFKLNPKVTELGEFQLEQDKDRRWKRLYRQFEEAFIGQSINAEMVEVKNPWVMELAKANAGEISGFSLDLLEIENRATGYKIQFLVDQFKIAGKEVSYSGKPLFTPLEPADNEENEKWIERRKTTYQGSRQHFLYALVNNRLTQEGFNIYNAKFDQREGRFKTDGSLSAEEVFKDGVLNFKDFLKVVYTKEKPEPAFVKAFSSETTVDMGRRGTMYIQDRATSKNQTSYLFVRSSRGTQISDQGFLKTPEAILEYGYWSWERVAELLPYEYQLDLIEPQEKTEALVEEAFIPRKNGFDLSKAQLPIEEIIVAAPRRDAIRSIDRPKFENSSSVTWLKKKDPIIAIDLNGEARAYPISILERHEVVNDILANESVAITYCPLCGSGLAFSSSLEEQQLSFGVSGLLYNNNVLLFDRNTNSLWSQIEAKAVAGELSGKSLDVIPLTRMTWADWKDENPEGKVLSNDTGFDIDYSKSPYQGYEQTTEIPFLIGATSDQLKPKDIVIGISVNNKYKAYSLKKLSRLEESLQDELAGETLTISYNKENEQVTIIDQAGNAIKAMQLYWFSWYAFHPDTLLFK